MTLPYKDSSEGKKEQVAQMFDNISSRYDFLNHFLSLGIDKGWRRKAIKLLRNRESKMILDVATGTGDFALESLKLSPQKVIGIDISDGMLNVGRDKVEERKLDHKIELLNGDSEAIPFDDQTFDIVTVGFGVRNFENLKKGLKEMHRVLNKNGAAAILEFSKPQIFPIKQMYGFYFKYILPSVGRMVSKDNSAYTYLPESVDAFPDGKDFLDILESCGYRNVRQHSLMFGIASIYMAEK